VAFAAARVPVAACRSTRQVFSPPVAHVLILTVAIGLTSCAFLLLVIHVYLFRMKDYCLRPGVVRTVESLPLICMFIALPHILMPAYGLFPLTFIGAPILPKVARLVPVDTPPLPVSVPEVTAPVVFSEMWPLANPYALLGMPTIPELLNLMLAPFALAERVVNIGSETM
jgi:hypothetical protein